MGKIGKGSKNVQGQGQLFKFDPMPKNILFNGKKRKAILIWILKVLQKNVYRPY